MNKRALIILCLACILPSLALCAPVKRFKMRGTAKETTLNLKGVKSTDRWATGVSIAQTGSSVTINFQQLDAKKVSWTLKKTAGGWSRNVAPFEVPPPSGSDFYYCEMSGSLGLKLAGKQGAFASLWRLDCDDEYGTVTAVSALALKLRR